MEEKMEVITSAGIIRAYKNSDPGQPGITIVYLYTRIRNIGQKKMKEKLMLLYTPMEIVIRKIILIRI